VPAWCTVHRRTYNANSGQSQIQPEA
jgi:hypothetical protein